MKHLKSLKAIIPFLIIISVFSCDKNDDDISLKPTSELIGEWQRSDFSDDFEYKLIFYTDETGLRTEREGNMDTQVISNATSFEWSTNDNLLTLDIKGEIIITEYSINANGQLFLSDFTELHFNPLD